MMRSGVAVEAAGGMMRAQAGSHIMPMTIMALCAASAMRCDAG